MGAKENDIEFNRLLIRHLSGELGPEETVHFKDLLNRDPEKQVLLDEYSRIWENLDAARDRKSYDMDAEWALLKERLPASGILPESHSRAGRRSTASRSFLFYTYRIAAVLVAGIIFAFAWIYGSRMAGTELIVAGNTPVEAMLEDGTKVTLNSESRIRVPGRFTESGRQVFLKGEAWFDVTRDTLRPFTVDAGSVVVRVLGTRFNVNAYMEDAKVEVTVQSGVVALAPKQNSREQIVLRAGNSGTFDKERKELVLNQMANPNNISWKTRELYFEQTPLGEVMEVVSKVYHTPIEIMNPEMASCPITVTFKNQTLESVLNVLGTTLDLEIERSSGMIRLNGPGCVE